MTDNREAWRVEATEFPAKGSSSDQLGFLLRYAILAPSSHNSQPWKFVIGDGAIDVHADHDRWLRVADADQRELYLSVGCAIENLTIAAEHFGLGTDILYSATPPESSLAARVRVSPALFAGPTRAPALFTALTSRHTSHETFGASAIAETDLVELKASAGSEVHTILTSDATFKGAVDDLMLRADGVQFADPKWRSELAHWLGEGAFGQPWFIAKMASLAVKHLDLGRSMEKKDHEALMSAPIFGVICTRRSDRSARIKAGQAFERLWLAAEGCGISIQPMNQILQVADVKEAFVKLLPTDSAPAITFRLGYGAPAHKLSPRRPLAEVVTTA